MATTTITDTGVDITFGRWEKLGGLISDQHLPFSAITSVEALDDLSEIRLGLRAPGYGGWRRNIGTFWKKGVKRLVCAERGRPAWHATLTGQGFDAVAIGDDDAAAIADAIRQRIG